MFFYMCPLLAWYSTSTRSVALLTVLDHRQRRIRFAQAHAVGQDAAVATSSAAYPAWTGWATPGGILRAVTDTVRSTAAARATGVGVEAGQKEAIINLNVVMVYGGRIPNVVQEIRKTVAQELFDQIGLVVKEINGGGIECLAGSPSRGVL